MAIPPLLLPTVDAVIIPPWNLHFILDPVNPLLLSEPLLPYYKALHGVRAQPVLTFYGSNRRRQAWIMTGGLSITWSNRHQQLFNETMTEAVKNGGLTVTRAGEFSFSEGFFEQKATKDFLDRIPREMLNETVVVWIEKRRKEGLCQRNRVSNTPCIPPDRAFEFSNHGGCAERTTCSQKDRPRTLG